MVRERTGNVQDDQPDQHLARERMLVAEPLVGREPGDETGNGHHQQRHVKQHLRQGGEPGSPVRLTLMVRWTAVHPAIPEANHHGREHRDAGARYR